MRHAFPDDGNGSRIMVTTRLSDVASYPDSSSPSHEMRLMDANQSWDLLRARVFKNQDSPPELENVGRKIAESCVGLPLAIVVIGGGAPVHLWQESGFVVGNCGKCEFGCCCKRWAV